jgi:hypothetical protein
LSGHNDDSSLETRSTPHIVLVQCNVFRQGVQDEACLSGTVKLLLTSRGVTVGLTSVSFSLVKLLNAAPASFFSAALAEQSEVAGESRIPEHKPGAESNHRHCDF